MTTHLDNARDAVAAAIAQGDALDELYSRPDRVPPHIVAAGHDKLRRAIKLAEVHSLLYIGEQLDKLVQLEEVGAQQPAASGEVA